MSCDTISPSHGFSNKVLPMGLFSKSRAKTVSAIIHELCYAAQHANRVLGHGAGVGFLSRHPFMIEHRGPDFPSDAHTFQFGRELMPFQFLAYETKDMVQVLGNGDFSGIIITTPESDSYVVTVSKPLVRPMGRDAEALAKIFVRQFGALDTSNLFR